MAWIVIRGEAGHAQNALPQVVTLLTPVSTAVAFPVVTKKIPVPLNLKISTDSQHYSDRRSGSSDGIGLAL